LFSTLTPCPKKRLHYSNQGLKADKLSFLIIQ
jgi:hypothetical protein